MKMICLGGCREPHKRKSRPRRNQNRPKPYGWKPAQRTNYSGDSYDERDALLREMGYRDYADYLASPLWRTVKGRVIAAKGERCALCPEPSLDVHHLRYHRDDILGRTLKYLWPLCRDCHESVEFLHGQKRPMADACAAFYRKIRLSR